MISIKQGKEYGDASAEYIVVFDKGMTVREFIKEWLTENPNEWGYFGIYDGFSIFGNPSCEYSHGILKGGFPRKYLNLPIIDVYGSGGWSRSDFRFVVR